MRVRSHSMETMVGSQRHRSPGVGGGVPASLSGGGLPQTTSECTKSTFTVSKEWKEKWGCKSLMCTVGLVSQELNKYLGSFVGISLRFSILFIISYKNFQYVIPNAPRLAMESLSMQYCNFTGRGFENFLHHLVAILLLKILYHWITSTKRTLPKCHVHSRKRFASKYSAFFPRFHSNMPRTKTATVSKNADRSKVRFLCH